MLVNARSITFGTRLSLKTNLSGLRSGCPSDQSSRRFGILGSYLVACAAFFSPDPVATEELPQRAERNPGAALRQQLLQLLQLDRHHAAADHGHDRIPKIH